MQLIIKEREYMSSSFKHITYEQRLTIKNLLDSGMSVAKIGAAIGFNRASIYREIDKGGGLHNYNPDFAQKITDDNQPMGPGRKLADKNLSSYIATLILEQHMSPEMAINYMKSHDCGFSDIPTTNTIYRAIDDGLIPGVSRSTLLSCQSKVFSGGQIRIPRWVIEKLGLKDGDILDLEITDDGKIIYTKNPDYE